MIHLCRGRIVQISWKKTLRTFSLSLVCLYLAHRCTIFLCHLYLEIQMIDVYIQISISERSSGWATNYKKNQKMTNFSGKLFIVNFTFEIYKCEFCSFLLFLQGNFQEKLNKLESESENKGGSYNFGRFLNFQFTTELAPQWND